MGFDLMKNFNAPYLSRSISEFWKRWHISLSTWFRDYVYLPLGGNRVARARFYRNLLITFIISGLWHGASWTYIVWGALNGLYLVVGHYSSSWRARVRTALGLGTDGFASYAIKVATTFGLTCFAWIFFRASNLHDAWEIITHLTTGWKNGLQPVQAFSTFDVAAAVIGIVVLQGVEIAQELGKWARPVQWPVYVRWPAYYVLIAAVALFGVFAGTQFIYFQF